MSNAKRVVLAGIADDKMDLFLLLNEGAGYEVAGIVDRPGGRETTRIAEILGVRVYESGDELPTCDVLIYGDESFRTLAAKLRLSPEQVWHEDDAWNRLTADHGVPEEDSDAHGSDETTRMEPIGETPSSGAASAPSPVAPAAGPTASGANGRELSRSAPGQAPSVADAPPPARSQGARVGAATAIAAHERLDDVELDALARLTPYLDDLGKFYAWTLERASATTGAAFGAIVPDDAMAPMVWSDRRAESGGPPAFVTDEAASDRVTRIRLGDAGAPGGAELRLVDVPERESADALVAAVTPALRSVAELDGLRRGARLDALVGAISGRLETGDGLTSSIGAVCDAMADFLGAAECICLWGGARDDVLTGVGSGGGTFRVPRTSTWMAGDGGESEIVWSRDGERLTVREGRARARGSSVVVTFADVPASAGGRRGVVARIRALVDRFVAVLPDDLPPVG